MLNFVSATWKDLPNILGSECTFEAVFHDEKIFIFANSSYYYDVKTKLWVDIIPANLRTVVYPVIYNNYVYTFPKLEVAHILDEYTGLFQMKEILLLCSKYNETYNKVSMIKYSDQFHFGGNIAIVKKMLYTIQRTREGNLQFLKAFMEDLEKFSVLCDDAFYFVKRPYLVALPCYPDYWKGSA